MTPAAINRLNALILLIIGLWGAFAANFSPTAFIPVVFGAIFLAAGGAFAKGNKVVVHIVVLLTILLVFMLAGMPLRKALAGDDTLKIIRLCTMVLSGVIATVVYIKSFIDARKNA